MRPSRVLAGSGLGALLASTPTRSNVDPHNIAKDLHEGWSRRLRLAEKQSEESVSDKEARFADLRDCEQRCNLGWKSEVQSAGQQDVGQVARADFLPTACRAQNALSSGAAPRVDMCLR